MIADRDPNAEWAGVPLLTSSLFVNENKSQGSTPAGLKAGVFPGEEFTLAEIHTSWTQYHFNSGVIQSVG